MERLAVLETDKHRWAVRPIEWCRDTEFKMSVHGGTITSLIPDHENHYAVFWKKEDAEFFVKCKEAQHQLEEKAGTMGRLPDETLDHAINAYKAVIEIFENTYEDCCDYNPALDKCTLSFLEELKKYRQKEEQGLLHKAPLKDGTPIWYVLNIFDEVMYVTNTIYIFGVTEYEIGEFGKKFWLSEEEAEKALAELKG